MTDENIAVNNFDVTSKDFERFYALDSVLEGVDRIFESLEYPKNDFVRKIFQCLSENSPSDKGKEKIGIDFSSPNIAKPFHVGHLRSTFIGRALSNLATSSGSDVVRINYLGDWGTQFGLLAAGYDLLNSESFKATVDPHDDSRLRQYLDVYVKANERAETDPEFRQKAMAYFARMENGADDQAMTFWRRVVDDSVMDLENIYYRLNVQFDAWESERAVAAPAKALIQDLEKKKILERSENNAIGINVTNGDNVRFVPLAKGDGTTLYLTRDVQTALHRHDNLSCTKLIYVTDQAQIDHFRQLKEVLNKIGRPDVAEKITHVPFGRVMKMSTRKGQAIFVEDVLDEGARRAEEEILNPDPHTKTPPGTVERRSLAEQLALSCLIVNDLRKRLRLEYEFDWSRVLETKHDSGLTLQKTFCRVSSICENCERTPVDLDVFRRSIEDKEGLELIGHVSRRLAPALQRSLDELELFPLTQYLFRLRKLCGAAVRNVRVVDAPSPTLRSSRFLLFNVSRKVLGLGLSLLGARPLAKI